MTEWTPPTEITLLSGGNPQIPKGDGELPVRTYIEAMPAWKREIGEQLDQLITETAPDVQKAVRWNSPFYGVEGEGWFVSFHCFAKYIKVTWFAGAQLDPPPPIGSKDPNVRYSHISPDDPIDPDLYRSWIEQAAALPGEDLF